MTQLSDILLPSSIITTDNTKILTNKTISGANNTLTSLNASNISIGTVPTARLGSGTADATTYLRGDNTWQVVSASGGGEFELYDSGSASNVSVSSCVIVAATSAGKVLDSLKAYPYVIFKVWMASTATNNIFPRIINTRSGSTAATSVATTWMHRENVPYTQGYYNYNLRGDNLSYVNMYNFTPFKSRYFEFHCLTHTPLATSVAEASWEVQDFYYKARGPASNSSTGGYAPVMADGTFRRYSASYSTSYGGITSFELHSISGSSLNVYVEIWGKVI